MPRFRNLNGPLRRLPAVLVVVAITGFALVIPWSSHSSQSGRQPGAAAAPGQPVPSSATTARRNPAPDRAGVGAHPSAAARVVTATAQQARDAALQPHGASYRPSPPADPTPTSSPSAGGASSSGSTNSTTSTTSTPSGYGCAAALAYLAANAAPGFQFQCPGYAYGHQAMTCVNHAPQCAGTKLIAINVPCPAAYKNEASNSWVLTKQRSGSIDPYGYCQ